MPFLIARIFVGILVNIFCCDGAYRLFDGLLVTPKLTKPKGMPHGMPPKFFKMFPADLSGWTPVPTESIWEEKFERLFVTLASQIKILSDSKIKIPFILAFNSA